MAGPLGAIGRWLKAPLRTLTVFVSLVLALATALVYLAWKTIDSERTIEQTQATIQLDNALGHVGAQLRAQLAALESLMIQDPAGTIPQHVVVIRAIGEKFESTPANRLPFIPGSPAFYDPVSEEFSDAEALEHSANNSAAAGQKYRTLANSPRAEIRAGALLRLGRMQRRSQQYRDATATYDQLEKLDSVTVEGLPSSITAMLGRMEIFKSTNQTDALAREAAQLSTALWSGKYNLTRASWEVLREAAPAAEQPDRLALAEATAWVHAQWLANRTATGRKSGVFANQPTLAIWRGSSDRLDVVIANSTFIQNLWSNAVAGRLVTGGLLDDERRVVAGAAGSTDAAGLRTEAVAGLPWTIYLTAQEDPATAALFANRRQMYVVGLVVLLLTLLAGSYFIIRSINREHGVARLQSEFVSAVSHEFRTPLTSMRQMSELLANGRVPSEADRQQTYEVLLQESERLQHLVESLLDFGRTQHGVAMYRFEPVDAAGLVDDVVSGFRTIAVSRGFEVKHERSDASASVLADRDALGLAIRNLLDNAVKYSLQCKTIWVDARVEQCTVGIRVRDQGMGIPRTEHRSIFDKFVRGAASREAGIKGTGIGLALAQQIVRAHHGEIQLHSEPGIGSTFTIVLPLADR